MKKYIVMDIGGTFIKSSVMSPDFKEESVKSTPTKRDPEEFLAQLVELIDGYKAQYGEILQGIAISMAGFINPVTGENTDYTCGERFLKYNLKEKLKELTGLRVSVENDSNCAALAEMKIGAGVGAETVCVMTVGTGIGAALIINGKLHRGKSFKAGELGFCITKYKKDAADLEPRRVVATSILVKRCSELLGKTVDGLYIFENLDKDAGIKAIYDEWVTDIAITVGNIAVALDPEKFLIGGAVSTQKRFIDDLKAKVFSLYHRLDEFTTIEACTQGNNAGKIGALTIFFDNYGE